MLMTIQSRLVKQVNKIKCSLSAQPFREPSYGPVIDSLFMNRGQNVSYISDKMAIKKTGNIYRNLQFSRNTYQHEIDRIKKEKRNKEKNIK